MRCWPVATGTSGRMSAGWCEQIDAAGMLFRSTDTMRPDPVHGAVAQLVAHLHGMEGVRGSNPLSSTEKLQVRDSPTALAVGAASRDADVAGQGYWSVTAW